MKHRNNPEENPAQSSHPIPDVEIINLEDDDNASSDSAMDDAEPETDEEGLAPEASPKRFRINIHIVLAAVAVLFLVGIVYKFSNWGQFIDQSEIFKDGQGTYEDTYDEFLPLIDENGNRVTPDYSDGLTIVAFGNAPFADDRDSEDGLANMIAKKTNATVYNCSVSGSYMASQSGYYDAGIAPMDAYSLYWLVTLATGADITGYYTNAVKTLGEDVPPDAELAYETLTSIDFKEVDVITIMYDATDYLLGHKMYNFDNPTDITQFAGNLEASLELLQAVYPHIRIIVMGTPYAHAIDENGKYVSSNIQRYGQDVLSVYSIMEWNSCASRGVTFIDHLYGTITEGDADDCLVDNLHLNKAGREKIADRFADALFYFDSEE